MKIKTNETIKDLKGKGIKMPSKDNLDKDSKEDFTVGEALSNILVAHKAGGKMKMYILAQKCATQKEFDVDKADLSLIKEAVENTAQYNNLVNGQLLVMLDGVKEK